MTIYKDHDKKKNWMDNKIAICIGDYSVTYPPYCPFNPSENYPEYLFGKDNIENRHNNTIYGKIRQLLFDMGYDQENFGNLKWNPLSVIIKPGMKVFVKPNLVNHTSPNEDFPFALITHSSVIRVIIDYIVIALKNDGQIIIGDSPIQGADFQKILKITALDELIGFYTERIKGIHFEICDLREQIAILDKDGNILARRSNNANYMEIDLGTASMHSSVSKRFAKYRIGDYNKRKIYSYHQKNSHIYCIASKVLESNVMINIPKLKTHKLAGLTCSLKNIVGTLSIKECFPHYTTGSLSENGDQYLQKSFRKKLLTKVILEKDIKSKTHNIIEMVVKTIVRFSKLLLPFKDNYLIGDWYGNDTVWRSIIDLNKILLFTDSNGQFTDTFQRDYLTIVDGIIAGHKEGPLAPEPIAANILILGENPLLVDVCASVLMDFDYQKIPQISHCLGSDGFFGVNGVDELPIKVNGQSQRIHDLKKYKKCFIPNSGWKDYFELQRKLRQ